MSILNNPIIDDEFVDGLEENKTQEPIETRLMGILSEVKEMQRQLQEQLEVIQEQNDAIVLLKEYIVEKGIAPFWGGTFDKRPSEMSRQELIERSKSSKNEYKRATSTETTPFPTVEEQLAMYKARQSEEISTLIQLMAESKKPEAATAGIGSCEEDCGCGNFGMDDED